MRDKTQTWSLPTSLLPSTKARGQKLTVLVAGVLLVCCSIVSAWSSIRAATLELSWRQDNAGCWTTDSTAYNNSIRALSEAVLGRYDAVSGCVSTPYLAPNYDPDCREGVCSEAHAGVDLRTKEQPPALVRSFLAGKVIVNPEASKSTLVIQPHDGKHRVLYLHMSEIRVRDGQSVAAGDVVGVTGAIGTKEPHLHIEVWPATSPLFTKRLHAVSGSACASPVCTKEEVSKFTKDPVRYFSSLREGPSASVSNSPGVVQSPPTPPLRPDVKGSWRGHYYCSQGLTLVTLDIFNSANGELSGVFSFSPPMGGRGSAGSFEVSIEVRDDGVTVRPVRWIARPPGYDMVGAELRFVGSNRLSGRITAAFPGCGEIDISRGGSFNQTARRQCWTAVRWRGEAPRPARDERDRQIDRLLDALGASMSDQEASAIIAQMRARFAGPVKDCRSGTCVVDPRFGQLIPFRLVFGLDRLIRRAMADPDPALERGAIAALAFLLEYGVMDNMLPAKEKLRSLSGACAREFGCSDLGLALAEHLLFVPLDEDVAMLRNLLRQLKADPQASSKYSPRYGRCIDRLQQMLTNPTNKSGRKPLWQF